MAPSLPLFAQDQGYPPWLLRRQYASILNAGVGNPITDLLVTPAAGLQVSVAAGDAYVQQTVESTEARSSDQGLYYVYNDAAASPYNTITAPLTNPRVDQVILRVYDIVEQVLSGASRAQFEWLPGTETGGANLTNLAGAAALPANSLRIAYVLQTVGEVSISAGNILMTTLAAMSAGTLRTVAASTSQILAYGTRAIAIPGITLTLPAPLLNATIGIVANASITGASPVTIVYGAGAGSIFGGGVAAAGASSFLLGSSGAAVTLVSDGVNWLFAAGQQDSGWVPLTLTSGVIQKPAGIGPPTLVPSAKLKGDTVQLKGAMQNNTGAAIAANGTWATVPGPLRPLFPILPVFTVALASGPPSPASSGVITITGLISVDVAVANLDVVGLDGVNYQIS